jgi:hypothetical protein
MWVGILDERVGFVRKASSPVHAAVFCVAAPQRASALQQQQQAKRGDGGVLIAGGKASGQNKSTDDGNSLSLFSRKTTDLN